MDEEGARVTDAIGHEDKYLTFRLGEGSYGIGIGKIREINGMMNITEVPHLPDHIRGVINLRGEVMPVIDLRLRFGMPEVDPTERTCIIVLEVGRGEDTVRTGALIDEVSEVLPIKRDDIEPPPAFAAFVDPHCILGMAKADGGVKILLDVDRVLTGEEIEAVKRTS
jgi:purine-binding chemotaxis protein CheW